MNKLVELAALEGKLHLRHLPIIGADEWTCRCMGIDEWKTWCSLPPSGGKLHLRHLPISGHLLDINKWPLNGTYHRNMQGTLAQPGSLQPKWNQHMHCDKYFLCHEVGAAKWLCMCVTLLFQCLSKPMLGNVPQKVLTRSENIKSLRRCPGVECELALKYCLNFRHSYGVYSGVACVVCYTTVLSFTPCQPG